MGPELQPSLNPAGTTLRPAAKLSVPLILATWVLLLAPTSPVSAQELGDSVRVRLTPSAPWMAGRLTEVWGDSIAVRSRERQRTYTLAALERIDRWERVDPLAYILVSAAVSGATWFGVARLRGADGALTSSATMDGLVGVGVGALLGTVFYVASPGRWKRIF